MAEFAKPGPEHKALRRLTGAWTARIKRFEAPGAPAKESNGEFLARMDVGEYFLCREMNFGMAGFQGRGLIGWDPFARRYVGTWIDSQSPIIYRTEGDFDARGVFCETSSGPDATGVHLSVKLTTEMLEPNHMVFRMKHVTEAGEEWLALEIEHTRRRFV